MGKQFYYKRIEPSAVQIEGQEKKFNTYIDSFNVDLVIRSLGLEDGKRLVLLNDVHERPQEIPIRNKKGEITGYKRERNVFQSEIYLESEDAALFLDLD